LADADAAAVGSTDPGIPTWRAGQARREGGNWEEFSLTEHPGDDGVGVPHLTEMKFISSPYRRWNVSDEIKASLHEVIIFGQQHGAGDCVAKIGNEAVGPTPNFIPERSKSMETRQADGSLGDNPSVPSSERIRCRCDFDGDRAALVRRDEGRVKERAPLAALNGCTYCFEDSDAHADHRCTRTNRNPVQIKSSVYVVLGQH
jgi:hypothetical protein